jgi:chorismate-pyruvate lyase
MIDNLLCMTNSTTRMFLQSDGSTTVMLESFFNTSLKVNVFKQDYIKNSQLSHLIRKKLKGNKEEVIIERYSGLYTQKGRQISTNWVLFRKDVAPKIGDGVVDAGIPIGKIISSYAFSHFRKIDTFGKTKATFDDETKTCAYKQYVIWSHRKPLFFIREIFNPDFVVPLDDGEVEKGTNK